MQNKSATHTPEGTAYREHTQEGGNNRITSPEGDAHRKKFYDGVATSMDASLRNGSAQASSLSRNIFGKHASATLMLAMIKVAQREQPAQISRSVLLLAMTKKAANSSVEKKAGMEDILKQYVDPWAQSAYSSMYGPQGLQQRMGLPGSPWMYSTGLGAGAGGLIGGYFGNPMAGSLIGGGLGYLLNQWAKSRYGQQAKPAATSPEEAGKAGTTLTGGAKVAAPAKAQPVTPTPAPAKQPVQQPAIGSALKAPATFGAIPT